MTRAPVLQINLDAIAQNYLTLQNRAPTAQIAAAVKADAYGLGMSDVAMVLYNAGCRAFFTAQSGEALALRDQLKDKKHVKIYCLSGPTSENDAKDFIAHNIIPVLNSREQIVFWNAKAKRAAASYPALLHFDTGMNRLGLSGDECQWALQNQSDYDHIDIQAIMSHPVNADKPEDPRTEDQLNQLMKIKRQYPDTPVSFCNSAAIFSKDAYHLDLVRPGIALYGGNPIAGRENQMQPVVSLSAPVIQVRPVKAGESAGYGPDYIFKKDALLATIGIGYADGILRSLCDRGRFYFNNRPCPIRGRISMDLTVIEISEDMRPPKPGDQVEILGKNQDLDALAADAGTISYEILTMLGKQLQKCYSKS